MPDSSSSEDGVCIKRKLDYLCLWNDNLALKCRPCYGFLVLFSHLAWGPQRCKTTHGMGELTHPTRAEWARAGLNVQFWPHSSLSHFHCLSLSFSFPYKLQSILILNKCVFYTDRQCLNYENVNWLFSFRVSRLPLFLSQFLCSNSASDRKCCISASDRKCKQQV